MALFRRTFLRQHVVQELADDQYVLPVVSLRQKVEAKLNQSVVANPKLRQLLSQQEFFGRGMSTGDDSAYPGQQLYWPIPVRSTRRDVSESTNNESLTDLIQSLSREQNQQGILLTAASGAGKTLACRKAFCDCIEFERHPALLAEHLPCWVRTEGRLRDRHAIEGLILRASGIDMSLDRLQWYLRHSPPVLFFFDLNSADIDDGRQVALDLSRFQLEWGRFGHRCIVASRNMPPGDPVRAALLDSSAGAFREFTLAPLSLQACGQYLRNHREFEQEVRITAGLDLPASLISPERIEEAVRRLENLLEHTDTTDGGFVSVPLLLHFTTEVNDRQADVRTVSDLYDRIVEQHLGREEETYGRQLLHALGLTPGATRHELTLAALTRIALTIRARASAARHISLEDLHATLQRPSGDWIPPDRFWYRNPVFRANFDREFIDRWLLSSSLLKCNGQTVQFLHDSFVDYFCGRHGLLASVAPRGIIPEIPHIVDRLTHRPDRWAGSIGFLGGVLSDTEFVELIEQLLVTRPLDGLPKLVLEMSQGTAPAVPLARTLANSHVIYSWQSLQDPRLLPGECHGILLSERNESADVLASRIRERHAECRLPFLHLTTPVERGWLPSYAHQAPLLQLIALSGERADRPGVAFVDITGSLWCWWHGWENARQVAESNSYQVDPWGNGLHLLQLSNHTVVFLESDITTGTHFTVAGLTSSSVSVLRSGRLFDKVDHAEVLNSDYLVLLMDSYELKVWSPTSDSPPLTVARLPHRISAYAVNGQSVVAGCATGQVFLCSLQGTDPIELPTPPSGHTFRSDCDVNCVTFLTPNTVVAGRTDGHVLLWSLDPVSLLAFTEHSSDIYFVCSRRNDELVVVTNVEVLLWQREKSLTRVAVHPGRVTAVELLSDGSVVSADDDGFVRRTMPGSQVSTSFDHAVYVASGFTVHTTEGDHEAEGTTEGTLAQHGVGKTLLGRTPEDVIISSGDDCRIRLWSPRFGANRIRSPHKGTVNRLVPLAAGGVCSLDNVGQGILWDGNQDGQPPVTLYEYSGRAIELSDGRVAVVSPNKFSFCIWNIDARKLESGPGFFQGDDEGFIQLECTGAVALPNAGLATAHADGMVYVWDTHDEELSLIPQHRENPPILQHQSRVTAIASLSDGTVVSGDEHGKLLAARGDRMLELPDLPNAVLSIAPVSQSSVLVTCQDAPTVWELSLENASPIPRLRFDDGENALSLTVLSDGSVGCLGTDGSIKRYMPSSSRVGHVLAAAGRSGIHLLPSGRIVVTDSDEVIEVIEPDLRVVTPLAVNHRVTSVAERHDGEIVLGTSSGFVLRCRLEATNLQAVQRTSDTGPIDVGRADKPEQSEDDGRLLTGLVQAANSLGMKVDYNDSSFAELLSESEPAIGDPLFDGLDWIARGARELIAVLEDANRFSLRWSTREISPAHVLLAIIDDRQNGFGTTLTSLGIPRDAVESLALKDAPQDWESTLTMGRSTFNRAALDWLNHAVTLAEGDDDFEVSTAHVMLSLLRQPVSPLRELLDECGVMMREAPARMAELLQAEIGRDSADAAFIDAVDRDSLPPVSVQLADRSPWCAVAVAARTLKLIDLKPSEWPSEAQSHRLVVTGLMEILEASCVHGRASKRLVSVCDQLKAALADVAERRIQSKQSWDYDRDAGLFRVERFLTLHRQLLVVALAVASGKGSVVLRDDLQILLTSETLRAHQAEIQANIERLDGYQPEEEGMLIAPEYFGR